jgi:hypothetical protein
MRQDEPVTLNLLLTKAKISFKGKDTFDDINIAHLVAIMHPIATRHECSSGFPQLWFRSFRKKVRNFAGGSLGNV